VTVNDRWSMGLPTSSRKEEALLAARVAELHYNDGMSNTAIGDVMGISRFRVARLLELARSAGIVTIQVKAPAVIDPLLSRRLRARFQLAEALVISSDPITDAADPRSAVGAVAAQFVSELVGAGAKIGIAWGKTVAEFAVASRQFRFPRCDAVQLLGNLPTRQGSMHAGDVLRTFADTVGGEVYPLHTPVILPDQQTARGMRSETSTMLTRATYNQLDVAVLGVGSWNPPSSQLLEVLSPDDLARIRDLKPIADVCANLFDEQGHQIVGEFSERTMGISREQIEKVPMAVVLAVGSEKVNALRTVLSANLVSAVVADASLAAALLSSP
jgi:DNA-binding transcriptional regulator LsrR (DeoR family)